ncbi:MAG: 50S ribosomal protein L17 [Bacteroidetes bacterium]|nr:50S ribosomal protein L17 [Bacteroidota bacterium]
MKHGKKINHLSRKSQHRHATLSNMAASLIMHKKINTTLAKAKALRVYVEPIISRSKSDTTHSRRMVFRYLQNKDAVITLFRDIAPKVGERHGGYTRILKTGFRIGDNANTCLIELVDFNESMLSAKTDKAAPAKKTRRSRGGKKAEVTSQKAENEQTSTEDAIKTEEPKSE